MPRIWVSPVFPKLALGLVALAWFILAVVQASPYGRYMQHGDWSTLGFGTATCIVPLGSWLGPVAYAGGWLLMTAAMMLPTTLPLVRLFDRMIAARGDSAALHASLITGYLGAWSTFGMMMYWIDWLLHVGLGGWPWLARRPWFPSLVILAIAGAFQFSELKYHCLEKCRTPLGFILGYWHGGRPKREAFNVGWAHGIYCIGCCWALMLLMFAIGMGNLGWMLLLGSLMALEKNVSWGRHLSVPIGGALLISSGLIGVFELL